MDFEIDEDAAFRAVAELVHRYAPTGLPALT